MDVKNGGAKTLYERAGYTILSSLDHRYAQFTRSLNLHDGATKGRNHYLLAKDLHEPMWLPEKVETYERGTLGFEIAT